MSLGELTTLPSGLRVASRTLAQARSISVGIWVNAGARDERDAETGIAHMLEHMAFKGTKRRSARDIATEVENVGGYMNAHTSREETAYYLRLLPEYLDMGIDILADILTGQRCPTRRSSASAASSSRKLASLRTRRMTSSSTCLPKRHMADIRLAGRYSARSTASAGFRVMTFEPSWGAITGPARCWSRHRGD